MSMMDPDHPARTVATAVMPMAHGAPKEPAPRTILIIATELDTAQKEAAAARLIVASADAKVKALTLEIRDFGKRKRAPKERG